MSSRKNLHNRRRHRYIQSPTLWQEIRRAASRPGRQVPPSRHRRHRRKQWKGRSYLQSTGRRRCTASARADRDNARRKKQGARPWTRRERRVIILLRPRGMEKKRWRWFRERKESGRCPHHRKKSDTLRPTTSVCWSRCVWARRPRLHPTKQKQDPRLRTSKSTRMGLNAQTTLTCHRSCRRLLRCIRIFRLRLNPRYNGSTRRRCPPLRR